MDVFEGGGTLVAHEEEEKEEHEGAFFLQDTDSFHTAPQLEPRCTRSGTTSSLIFR